MRIMTTTKMAQCRPAAAKVKEVTISYGKFEPYLATILDRPKCNQLRTPPEARWHRACDSRQRVAEARLQLSGLPQNWPTQILYPPAFRRQTPPLMGQTASVGRLSRPNYNPGWQEWKIREWYTTNPSRRPPRSPRRRRRRHWRSEL